MTTEEQETVEEVVEAPEAEPTEPAGEQPAEAPEPDEDAVEDEVIVTVGDAPPPEAPAPEERDPKLVNKLRKLLREQERKVREYETKLKAAAPPVENAPPTLGAKPKLEDLDYDAEKYEEALASWFEKKRAADDHAAKLRKAQEEEQNAWKSRLDAYGKAKASLRVRDYEDAESNVVQSLDVTQQGIIVSGADNPALVTYALGKDSAKLAELRAITDPVKFAFAVAKLETQLKVTPRKPASAPETIVKSNTRVAGSVDSVLERLEEEADRTGDRSRVVAYKAKLRAQAKK